MLIVIAILTKYINLQGLFDAFTGEVSFIVSAISIGVFRGGGEFYARVLEYRQ